MKDRKRVMCGGLAFSDCEDMEMLHQYAKEGWVFEKFRGMCYILQKQEPVNRIFSYDMQKLKEDEKEAYFQLFENSGWHIINPEGKDVYFFWAEEGCVPLHSEVETRMEGYRSTLHIFAGALVIGCLCLLSLLWIESSVVSMILLMTGSILGGCRPVDGGRYYAAYEEKTSSYRESYLSQRGSAVCVRSRYAVCKWL